MSTLKHAEMPPDANTQREQRAQPNQRTKVLSNRECPSCLRKGSMEVFFRKQGAYTYCYSCGYRETSFSH